MATPDQASPDLPVAARLRRYRRRRRALLTALLLLTTLIVLDHLGCFRSNGDDHKRFDRKTALVLEVLDGTTVSLRIDGTSSVTARLLGVDIPPGDIDCKSYLHQRLANRNVTIRIEPLQTRDAGGNLLVLLYLNDADAINLMMVRDGVAFCDRRVTHLLRAAMEMAESDARRHLRGLWANPQTRMPAWREAWLKELHEKHPPVD